MPSLRLRRTLILPLVLLVTACSVIFQKPAFNRTVYSSYVSSEGGYLKSKPVQGNHYLGALYNASSSSKQLLAAAIGDDDVLVEVPIQPTADAITQEAYKNHEYLANGLLVVNPNAGAHPISELIYRAEQEWDAKHKRQSKTLAEAVKEYRRRYGRVPPRGFDRWWSYVQTHNVLLPDEYDQIERDLASYWGVHPYDLRRLISELEHHPDSFVLANDGDGGVIHVADANLNPQNEAHFLSVAEEHMSLLRPVQDAIPEFRAIFTPHDNPMLVKDWMHHQAALNASATGTCMQFLSIIFFSTDHPFQNI
jgi:hypothetical protein